MQHKFRLGPDSKEAERRDVRLRELWDRIVEVGGEAALWDGISLAIAKHLARGEDVIRLAPQKEESDFDYSTNQDRAVEAHDLPSVARR